MEPNGHGVVTEAHVGGEPISVALAERAVKDLVRQTAPVVLLSDIESVVSIYFGLTPADLQPYGNQGRSPSQGGSRCISREGIRT